MASSVFLVGWAAAAFGLGLAGTALARAYAMQHRMLDEPGARRSHAVATPRGGGISIAFVLALALTVLVQRFPEGREVLAASLLALVLVAGIGWLDDHRPLPALARLLVHVAAAASLALALLATGGGAWPAALAFAAVLVLVNAWNFMDGIDGLATSQAVLVALAYLAWLDAPAAALLALALAAAACGFLPFNFPRARIFLGDVGSGALGLAVAVLLVLAIVEGSRAGPVEADGTALLLLLLPPSAFLVDTSLTLARRMVRRERWWTPHVDHAYQRWAAHRGNHVPVTLAYAAWTATAAGVMAGMQTGSATSIMAVVTAWYLMAVVAWFRLQGRSRAYSEGRRA